MELELMADDEGVAEGDGPCADVCATADEDADHEGPDDTDPRAIPEAVADEGAAGEDAVDEDPRAVTEATDDEGTVGDSSICTSHI